MEKIVDIEIDNLLTKVYEQLENGEKLNLTSDDIKNLNVYLESFLKQIKEDEKSIERGHRYDNSDLRDTPWFVLGGAVCGAVTGCVTGVIETGAHINEYLNRPEIADKINEIYNNTGASSIEELKYFFTNDVFANQHIQDSFTFNQIIDKASDFAVNEMITSVFVFAVAVACIASMYPTSKFIKQKIKQKKEERKISKKEQTRKEIEAVLQSAKSSIASKEMQDLKKARDYKNKNVAGKIAFVLKEGVSKIKSVNSEESKQL